MLSCSILSLFQQEYGWKEKSADDETRKYSDKLRDVCALAERLGCSFGQLAIAWSLKNESVQCLLLGASNIDQLYESLQSLQVIIFNSKIWYSSKLGLCEKRRTEGLKRVDEFLTQNCYLFLEKEFECKEIDGNYFPD